MSTTMTAAVAKTLPAALYTCCTFTDVATTTALAGTITAESFTGASYSVSGNGSCKLTASTSSCGGCPKSIPVSQSLDLCDLALSAYDKLIPESLNMFGAPCS